MAGQDGRRLVNTQGRDRAEQWHCGLAHFWPEVPSYPKNVMSFLSKKSSRGRYRYQLRLCRLSRIDEETEVVEGKSHWEGSIPGYPRNKQELLLGA